MSKKKQSKGAPYDPHEDREYSGNQADGRAKCPKVRPRNAKQEEYMSLLGDASATIVFATGPAGTGKTMLAVHEAAQQYKRNFIDRIVITRPAVTNDEEHGFLPGDLNEKMEPWVKPMTDIFREHFMPSKIATMLKYEHLEFSPLAYMRGRTFKHSIIIADEMQNSSVEQMKMLLTRIGEGSKMIVTGDLEQHDRGADVNGLEDFIERIRHIAELEHIHHVGFELRDIERHPAVAEVLGCYDA